jgi:hypothetical protein
LPSIVNTSLTWAFAEAEYKPIDTGYQKPESIGKHAVSIPQAYSGFIEFNFAHISVTIAENK